MKRTAFVLILCAALMALIGCSSTTTTAATTTKTIATASGPVKVPTATPVSAPTKQKLTPEQEKNNEAVLAAVETAKKTEMMDEIVTTMPKWVADHYRAFGEEGYTKEKAAFQRAFGWGIVSYRGGQHYWFAHTNTDAWLQFDLSVGLTGEDLAKIRERKDGYGHKGEAELVETTANKAWFIPGTVTWFGTNNDWTDTRCVRPDYQPCDIGGALDDEVTRLNKDLGPGLAFATKGKFIW